MANKHGKVMWRSDRAPVLTASQKLQLSEERRRAKCGTTAGYAAHRRRKEVPCDSCRAADREYRRKFRADLKKKMDAGFQLSTPGPCASSETLLEGGAHDTVSLGSGDVGATNERSSLPKGYVWCPTCQKRCWYASVLEDKCRTCRRHAKRPVVPRDELRAARYGMTVDQLTALTESQDGKCAICRMPTAAGKMLVIDHDHETGLVRGLLCNPCNTGIGLLGDSPERLVAAADYLASVNRRRVVVQIDEAG